jgi:hypothetical protein
MIHPDPAEPVTVLIADDDTVATAPAVSSGAGPAPVPVPAGSTGNQLPFPPGTTRSTGPARSGLAGRHR